MASKTIFFLAQVLLIQNAYSQLYNAGAGAPFGREVEIGLGYGNTGNANLGLGLGGANIAAVGGASLGVSNAGLGLGLGNFGAGAPFGREVEIGVGYGNLGNANLGLGLGGAGLGLGVGGAGLGLGGSSIVLDSTPLISSATLAPFSGYNIIPSGPLAVTTISPIGPSGLAVASENYLEGVLSVSGQLPWLSAVAFEGAVPTSGSGVATCGCGSGQVGITSQSLGPAPAPAPFPGSLPANIGGLGLGGGNVYY